MHACMCVTCNANILTSCIHAYMHTYREKAIESVCASKCAVVLYEAPHRILSTLKAIAAVSCHVVLHTSTYQVRPSNLIYALGMYACMHTDTTCIHTRVNSSYLHFSSREAQEKPRSEAWMQRFKASRSYDWTMTACMIADSGESGRADRQGADQDS